MVSFKAVCMRLGIDKSTLYRLIREGKLEFRKNGQRGRNCVTLRSVEEMERIGDLRSAERLGNRKSLLLIIGNSTRDRQRRAPATTHGTLS
jgi:excisionase family DNA binding protein